MLIGLGLSGWGVKGRVGFEVTYIDQNNGVKIKGQKSQGEKWRKKGQKSQGEKWGTRKKIFGC